MSYVPFDLEKLVDRNMMKAFLRAYMAWCNLCRPRRIENKYCGGCPLDEHHFLGLCGAMQEFGHELEKKVEAEIKEIKHIQVPDVTEYEEFLKKCETPGPDLYQKKE